MNNTSASNETSEALLNLALQNGYIVSPTQLVRWHRAGLLPRPRQLPLKETRGTNSLYPSGTSEQLLVLCELRKTKRRFSHLAWQLWLAGYPINPRLIRMQIAQATSRLAHRMQWFAGFKQLMHASDTSEEALDLIEHFAAGDLLSRPLRRARKRIGRRYFSTFLRLLAELATEQSFETTSSYNEQERLLDLRIFALGLGMEKRFVQKKDALEYYLDQILMPQLQWLFCRLQEVNWEDLLENATKFDLLQTRDELRTWLTRLSRAQQYRDRLANDYPRFELNALDVFCSLSMADQALVLVCWLALRLRSPFWLHELISLVPIEQHTHSFLLHTHKGR